MLRKITNKKAQVEFSPAVAISFIIALFILAPIMLRVIGITTGKFFSVMNETAPYAVAQASPAVDKVYNFFDYLIIIGMTINILILFISAWFIDTNPIFIIFYIIFAFILFLFIPNLLDAVDKVYIQMNGLSTYDVWGDTSLPLQYTQFAREHMIELSLIIIVLTGIIMYAKIKLLGGSNTY